MKKAIITTYLMFLGIMLAVGTIRRVTEPVPPAKPSPCGYKIIERGVGVDCTGDTIKLVKSRGFYMELATQ